MKLKYESDASYGSGAALGLIVLSTDETLEPEARQAINGADISLYHTRIPFDPVVTQETLARMEAELPTSVALLSQHVNFGAIGYGCTSGATVIGSDSIAAKVQEQFPGVPVTDPILAVIAACNALGVKKLGMLTPYNLDVSAAMQKLLEKNKIKITSFGSFEEEEDHKVARISEASTLDGLLKVGERDCDAVFASCTNLRSFGVIAQAETMLGKPVISSNSAFIWHLHKIAGFAEPISGPGKLYTL